MANPMNMVHQVGRIISEPIFLETKKGEPFQCRFQLSVKRNWTNNSGEYESDVFLVRISGSPSKMEYLKKYKKNQSVVIAGSLRTEKYEKNGSKQYSTFIDCQEISWAPQSFNSTEPDEQNLYDIGLPFA